MPSTEVAAADRLPLTCTRSGTCCHGKQVWLNPWELRCLADARHEPARAFRARHVDAGIRLRFDGPAGWKGLPACSMYLADRGCSVHAGRPLACRLYPLGRQRRGPDVRYIHQGRRFPCLDGCPAVVDLPRLSVAEYLAGQQVTDGEAAEDAYLETMQDLAEGAFVLLIDSGLAANDRATLPRWRDLGAMSAEARAAIIPAAWFDRLTLAPDDADPADPKAFVRAHHAALQSAAQAAFAAPPDADTVRDASCLMCALALHLAQALGMDTAELAALWIATARRHGAD